MIEPIYLSVAELAERWKQTPRQIVELGLNMRFPMFFMFDGLVFDVSNEWLRDSGASLKHQELEHLAGLIKDNETHIRRNAAGLTDDFSKMDSDQVVSLCRLIDIQKQKVEEIKQALENRESQRLKHHYRGPVRAVYDTLWQIQTNKETAFPYKALRPNAPYFLWDRDGNAQWDGWMVALEPGLSSRWKDRLYIDDLLVLTAHIEALEEIRESQSKEDPESQEKPVQRQSLQEQIIIETIECLGYTPTALPPFRQGSKSWVKSEVWQLLKKRPDMFTGSSFKHAWDRLRANRKISEKDSSP